MPASREDCVLADGRMTDRRALLGALAGAAAVGASGRALAQAYPARPVTLIVPYAPGGASDALGRLIAGPLGSLGQQVVVENRPGAGTLAGAQAVARAEANGYTLLLATSTTLAINASLYPKLPYDPVKDFAPVSLVAEVPFVLIVAPSVKATTLAELVALSKGTSLSYGSAGNGSPHHLFMELLKARTGLVATHVPYRGSAPAINDVVGGQTQLMFADLAPAQAQIEGGTIRALAVSTAARLPSLPQVPTAAEAGVPGYEATAWQGVVGPKGLPGDIVARLDAAIARAVAEPETASRLRAAGLVPLHRGPAEFAALVQSEIGKWARVVEASGAKVD